MYSCYQGSWLVAAVTDDLIAAATFAVDAEACRCYSLSSLGHMAKVAVDCEDLVEVVKVGVGFEVAVVAVAVVVGRDCQRDCRG